METFAAIVMLIAVASGVLSVLDVLANGGDADFAPWGLAIAGTFGALWWALH